MARRTGISWTDATWNVLVGCSHTSPGCDGCYAARDAAGRLAHLPAYAGLAVRPEGELARFTGEVRYLPERLDKPLRWQAPLRIFVNSTSDLFHPAVTIDQVAEIFAIMALGDRHTYQVLTKRPQRMAAVLSDPAFWPHHVATAALRLAQPVVAGGLGNPAARIYERRGAELLAGGRWPLPNVWLGTSVENDSYTFRANHLRATPAAIRWISAEPLLGAVHTVNLEGLDWVVAGGESGPRARRMDPEWARTLRDRCHDADVAFLFKQTGTALAGEWGLKDRNGSDHDELPADLRIAEYPVAA